MCKHKSGGMSRPANGTSSSEATVTPTSNNNNNVEPSSRDDLQQPMVVQLASDPRQTTAGDSSRLNPSGVVSMSPDPTESDEEAASSEQSPMLKKWSPRHCDIPTVCVKDGSTGKYLDFGYPCGHYVCGTRRVPNNPSTRLSVSSLLQRSESPQRPRHQQQGCAVYLDNGHEPPPPPPPEDVPRRHRERRRTREDLASSIPNHKTCSYPVLSVSETLVEAPDEFRPRVNTDITSVQCSKEMSNVHYTSVENSIPGPSRLPFSIYKSDDSKSDEFRSRSFSLTPTINFSIFESDSSSDEAPLEDILHPIITQVYEAQPPPQTEGKQVTDPPSPASPYKSFPTSYSAAQLSLASSYGDNGTPICKICHTIARDGDPLISPCRCSGTMQFIHCGCLMKWLEISGRRTRRPPTCELCQYQYHWHKKFKVRHWQFPHCSRRDKILHILFFLSMMAMVACATITIMCFKQDKGTRIDPERTELTHSEIVTLVCGVLFFLAFFVAMYVEVKARNTIYKLALKFVYLNQQWYIDEYDKKENSGPVHV